MAGWGGAKGVRRAGADGILYGRANVGEVGAPTLLDCFINDVTLDGTDRDGAKTGGQRAGFFTKPILGTDAATDLGQAIGLVTQVRRFHDAPLFGQLEPVGNVVVHRALPLAIGVATIQAPP